MPVKLRRIASVICFCLVLVLIASALSKLQSDAYMYQWGYDPDYEYEGLLVGSSHIYRTIIPQMLYDEYGLALLSASTGGQTSYQALCILEDTPNVEKMKVVVLDVFSFLRPYTYSFDYNHTLSSTGPEQLSESARQNRFTISTAMLRQMPEYALKKYVRLAKGQEMDVPLQYSFALFNSHSRYLRMDRSNYECTDARFARNKNYDPSCYVWPLEDPFAEEIEEDDSVHINEQCLQYLTQIIEFCQSRGIPLLLTAIPYDVTNEERIVLEEIALIAEEYGIDYLSMETIVDEALLDWSGDFMDHGHTNHYGSVKVTDYLGDYLSSYYDMEDRRDADTPDSPFLVNAYGYLTEETMLTNRNYPIQDYLESLYTLDDSYLLLFSTGESRGADLTESQREVLINLGFMLPDPAADAFDLMQINIGFEPYEYSLDPSHPLFTSIDAHTIAVDCAAADPVCVDHEPVSVPSENSRLLVFDRIRHQVVDSIAFGWQDSEKVWR